ncbi:hypothetical protein [Sphaerimonospora thailandensis]|uniref:Carbohydrate binding protein n=1 Tax=Sphaerimonospora thailandensis TaxID=795644 RepID=A0A8J3RBE4_9ACTN|nr:hypothetical protein [Sphaerimonospora thailandensis]GIH69433.1 hypothetical protein Mth01_16860 [Sphaerimonospora thailandensis]
MPNLLTPNQSSLDVDASGWTTGSGTFSRDATGSRSAPASLKIVSTVVGNTWCNLASIVTIPAGDVGKTYTLEAWAWTSLSGITGKVGVDWLGSGGATISTVAHAGQALTASTWTRVTMTATVPAGTVSARVFLPWAVSTATGQTFWFDDMWFGTVDVTGALAAMLPALTKHMPGNRLSANASDLETSIEDWVAASGTLSRSTTRAHSGSASLQLVSTAAGDVWAWHSWMYAVTPGETYTISAWVYTTLTGRTARLGVNWYGSSEDPPLETVNWVSGPVALTQNAWTFAAATVTVPAGMAWAEPVPCAASASAAGQTFWIDDMYFGVASASGPMAAALSPLSASDTGTLRTSGDLAAALGPLAADLAAETGTTGDLAALLPALTGDLDGETAASGTADAVLPRLAALLDAEAITAGDLTAVLPALTGDLAAVAALTGDLDATLPPLGADLDGAAFWPAPVSGDLTAALPALTGDVQGQAATAAALTATLATLTAALAGEQVASGIVTPDLPALGADLQGDVITSGHATATAPALTADLAAAAAVSADLDAALAALAAALDGEAATTGTLAASAPALTADLAAQAATAAALAASAPALTAHLTSSILIVRGIRADVHGPAILARPIAGPAVAPPVTVTGPDTSRTVEGVAT